MEKLIASSPVAQTETAAQIGTMNSQGNELEMALLVSTNTELLHTNGSLKAANAILTVQCRTFRERV